MAEQTERRTLEVVTLGEKMRRGSKLFRRRMTQALTDAQSWESCVPGAIQRVGQLGLFSSIELEGFPDSTVELTNVFATEDQSVIEFTGRGTNTGPLHMPIGDIPPTGKYSEVRFCSVNRVVSGKVVSIHQYFDVMTMLQQLGLVPGSS